MLLMKLDKGFFMNVAVGNGDMDLYKGDIDKASGLRLVKEENTLFLKGGIGYAFEREKTPPGEHLVFCDRYRIKLCSWAFYKLESLIF